MKYKSFTESSVQNTIKYEDCIKRYRKHPLHNNFTTYEITEDEYLNFLEIKKKYEKLTDSEIIINKIKELLK